MRAKVRVIVPRKSLGWVAARSRRLESNSYSPPGRIERVKPPPTVSVVLPTYNRTTLLREAAESVVRQTWETWELVVVDDGSTTPVEDWLPRDPRVHVLHLPHSGNIARVRNAGLGVATGVYVAFLDSDDLWDRRKLELQVARLETSLHAAWCHAAYDVIDERGNQ